MKELEKLDNSLMWSRKYTPQIHKQTFTYPLVVFAVLIFLCINIGVKRRAYGQFIHKGRRLETADMLDIDLDDVNSYPQHLFTEYLEKKKYDNMIERKDKKIDEISDQFHEYLQQRAVDTIQKREKRGLIKRKRVSPLESIDFDKWNIE